METAKASKNGPSTNGFAYRFDEFEIDPANRILLRGGVNVPLTAKVFDLLLVFAQNAGRLLEKDDLMDKIWHQSFVEEGNLARHVSMLRKALGDDGRTHKYISTVPGHGYRFLPVIAKAGTGRPMHQNGDVEAAVPTLPPVEPAAVQEKPETSRRWVLVIAAGLVLLTAAWFGTRGFFTPVSQIKTLAVLPLRSIDAGDNYLGIGIADAVIRKISQSREVTVRPTSAILHYANQDADALAAARELSTEAVLEGTIQRSGDRLRVSLNLLRASDGGSLWADNFDMPETDIFALQDRVAQQVASRLRLHLDAAQQAGRSLKYPANPAAYEFYIKGVFSLDQRGSSEEAMPQMQDTIGFFKRSIDADPNYAVPHAQLAWAYVWTAQFIEPNDPNWVDLARNEIKQADDLDPKIAETHLARAMLFWSKYENFQNDAALRELKIAQQLNASTSHGELIGILGHLGLNEQASAELQRALDIDPTSKSLRDLRVTLPYLRGDADAWINERKTPQGPYAHFGPWYYLRKGQLDDARKAIDERMPEGKKYPDFLILEGLYFALRGDIHQAESKVPELMAIVPVDEQRHHATYNAACIYALDGNSREAVKWLKETADTGFPNYPLFERDPFLDRIRQSPEFVQFISEQKKDWERRRREFGDDGN